MENKEVKMGRIYYFVLLGSVEVPFLAPFLVLFIAGMTKRECFFFASAYFGMCRKGAGPRRQKPMAVAVPPMTMNQLLVA